MRTLRCRRVHRGATINAMQIEIIAPDIHVAVGEAYGSNSTIFLNGPQALLIDGMGSAADAEELRRYVEGDLGAQVRLIVSTHYFSDHMAALGRFPGAIVIAHENYAHTFASEQHRTDEEASFFVVPDVTFSDRLTLRWGARTLELFHNPGHTMSTIGIDVADADLLFTADTVVGNIAYFVYSSMDEVAEALNHLRLCGRRRMIASHGGVEDASTINCALAYLRALRAGNVDEGQLKEFERVFHRRNVDFLRSRAALPAPSTS